MDFAVLPPEVNSVRMYSGPGPGPLLAAAASWNTITTELEFAAAGFAAVIAALAASWQGGGATGMLAAAAPVTAWLHRAAATAAATAGQASAAAGAFESTFAMTVPPAVIAANRALLAALVATNLLGQNTPAIAATEAHYLQMWVQDAVAMYTYAATSAAATRLPAFSTPTPHADPAGLGASTTTGPAATVLQQLAAPVVTTSPTLVDYLEHVPNLINTMLSTNNAVASGRSIDITNQRLAFQEARKSSPPVLVAAPAVTAALGVAPSVGG
ncbi:PPE family protein, partial [Mycolicibacillus trivialis]